MEKYKINLLIFVLVTYLFSTENMHANQDKDTVNSVFNEEKISESKRYFAFNVTCKDTVIKIYNDSTNGGNFVKHELIGYDEILKGYLIKRTFYEGSNYLLITKEFCQKIDLFGKIYISPNNQYFASVNSDIEPQYSPNGVQIFSIFPNGVLFKAIEDNIIKYGPEYSEWESDSIFVVKLYDIDEKLTGKRFYKYSDGLWSISINFSKKRK